MQTKQRSLVEAVTNTFTGTLLAVIISYLFCLLAPFIQEYIWAGFKWSINIESNLVVTTALTLVSICRQYIVRRAFNNHKGE